MAALSRLVADVNQNLADALHRRLLDGLNLPDAVFVESQIGLQKCIDYFFGGRIGGEIGGSRRWKDRGSGGGCGSLGIGSLSGGRGLLRIGLRGGEQQNCEQRDCQECGTGTWSRHTNQAISPSMAGASPALLAYT